MNITQQLKRVGRQEHVWHLLYGLGMAATISALLLLAFVVFETFFPGSKGLRTAMWWAWIITTSAVAGGLLARPTALLLGLIPTATVETLALRVGAHYDDIRDTLSNAIQLSRSARQQGSLELAEAAISKGLASADGKDLTVIIDKRPARRAAFWAVASIGVTMALLAIFSNSLGAAFARIQQYDTSFLPPAPFRIQITPVADTVMRGTSTHIDVTVTGTAPREVTLWIKEARAEQYASFPITLDTSATVRHQLPGLASTVTYYAEAPWNEDGVRSDTGRITVIDRPLIRTLSGRVIPPAYTRLAPTPLTERQADVTALMGSTVDLSVAASKTLTTASVIIERRVDSATVDSTIVPMDVQGAVAAGRFTVTGNGTYHIRLSDSDGQENAEPVRYGIVALRDGYPSIVMKDPSRDVDVDISAKLPLTVAVSDDYGFTKLTLHYRLIRSRYAVPEENYTALPLPIDGSSTTLEIGYVWDLADVGITPDDQYEYYLEVADNDIVNGPKTARTAAYKVRLPSLEEVFAETDEAQAQIQNELTELLEESEELRKEADELRREMQKQQAQSKRQTDWSDRKKAEDLAKRQAELEKRMEETVDKLEDMTNKLEQNNAISPETLEKYKELQELMKKVKSPELERMQQQMQKAMENLSPEELEKMMSEFKFDEEKFKQNIERTLDLLKRAQAEQKADELSKRAEELARRQDELRQQAENTNANDKQAREKLAQQQEQLQKDLADLARESKELEDLMKEIGRDMPMEQMDAAQKDLNADQTSQQMQDAQQQMQNGDMQSASEQQKNASESLQRFAQQMRQMQKQMRRNANREAMKQMQKGMDDMLDLSKQQEQLMQQMRGMDPSSSQFRDAAQQQQRLQQAMQNIANNMFQLSRKSTSVSPEMAQDLGDALQSMQNALGQMQERNSQMAAQQQGSAMQSMNSAAQRMSDALGSMMRGDGQGQGGQGQQPGQGQGDGMSPFQRLEQLAQQQQGINQGSQQVGQGGGGGGQMSQQQRAEMGRLAAQQGRALKALEELEQESRQVDGSKKPVGDLKQIAEDMREVMTDMQTGSITPETRMRQERILSRLLNASRSMNERDYEKTRESRVGQDVRRDSPDPLNLGDGDQRTMRQMMDQLRKGYTKDYENLIRLYFEALQKRRLQVEEQ